MKSCIKDYLKENLLTLVIFSVMIALYMAIPSQIAENLLAKSAISPRFFPTFSIVCVMICCALLIVIDSGKRIRCKIKDEKYKSPSSKNDNVSYRRVALVAAILMIWYLVLSRVGFIISTVVLIFLTSYILGCRHKITLVVFPLVFTLGLYFGFVNLLHVNLPEILF